MATSYTTRSRDTWDAIAARALGSELYMDLMITANPAHNYVARFDAGVDLDVPELPAATPRANVPAWRVP